jgi:hypothetical protein
MYRVVFGFLLLALCSSCSPSGPLQVELAVGSGERLYPFEFVASGPAVDEGVVCSGGDVEEGDFREEVAGLVTIGENTFICDDGSGSFVLETVLDRTGFEEEEGLPVGDWRVLSGTGSYQKLQGQGAHRYVLLSDVEPADPITVLQVLAGEVSSG